MTTSDSWAQTASARHLVGWHNPVLLWLVAIIGLKRHNTLETTLFLNSMAEIGHNHEPQDLSTILSFRTFYGLALTSRIPIIGSVHAEYHSPFICEQFDQNRAHFNSRKSHQSPKYEYAITWPVTSSVTRGQRNYVSLDRFAVAIKCRF